MSKDKLDSLRNNYPKKKVTYHIPQETYEMLNEMYAKRVSKKGKVAWPVVRMKFTFISKLIMSSKYPSRLKKNTC